VERSFFFLETLGEDSHLIFGFLASSWNNDLWWLAAIIYVLTIISLVDLLGKLESDLFDHVQCLYVESCGLIAKERKLY
jgi:hypothetical protein